MSEWLLDRLLKTKEQPTPRFAFQGTINWIKALSLFINDNFTNENLDDYYKNVLRKTVDVEYDTIAFENILMSMHNLSALEDNINSKNPYNICRSAIVSWYYCVYFGASAMIAASTNSSQETHADTALSWQNDIVLNNLAIMPFNLNLKTIEKKQADEAVANLKAGNLFDLNTYPVNEEQAYGALISYINGTADYERWRFDEKIKNSKDYKKAGFTSFRTKAAREMRDKVYHKHCVNFLVQSFRYRGKSNYRDSIYLSYGDDNTDKIEEFILNLKIVATGFLKMSSAYVKKRVQSGVWDDFINDLENNLRINIDTNILGR